MPIWRSKLFSSYHISALDRADELSRSFTQSGRFIFCVLAALIICSSLGLIYIFNQSFLVGVPATGGSYTEGIIGTPRFINPVLAISDADHDVASLVYSGLLKSSPSGTFIPDLAEKYDVSSDGKTYTVHLRPTAVFQDGMAVTASDVVFTVGKILEPDIKSPLRGNWDGVQVSEIDPTTVQFSLQKPYAPFVENLTVGILPKHLWSNVSPEEFPFSDLNNKPVGSGPYEVESVSRTSSGIPSSYALRAFKKYALGEAYITNFNLHFFQNEEGLLSALQNGSVDAGSGLSSSTLSHFKKNTIITAPLSRIFGVFFNQNQSEVLRDAKVRQALSDAVDRHALVFKILGGYGSSITGPIPQTLYTAGSNISTSSTSGKEPVTTAREELLRAGWSIGSDGVLTKTTGTGKKAKTMRLSFTLTTGTIGELSSAANILKDSWQKMGAEVRVVVFDQGDLSEQAIRPRKYDALLFGEIIGHGLDLFAFWDSSQRNDPGLNIALYANQNVDSYLEQLRQTQDDTNRQYLYQKITAQISADAPAIFLYSPEFVYIAPKEVHGIELGLIDRPSDRFNDVEHWYLETDHVWKIFTH